MVFDHRLDFFEAQKKVEKYWKRACEWEAELEEDKKALMKMLSEMLDTVEVHWFRNLSVGQRIEKLDSMTNRALRFEKAKAKSDHITGINMHLVIDLYNEDEYDGFFE